jgi:hypothetical protein
MTFPLQWLNFVASLCRSISGGAVALDGEDYQSMGRRPGAPGEACFADDNGAAAALLANRLRTLSRPLSRCGLPRPAVVDPAIVAARRNAALRIQTQRQAARIAQNARQVEALIALVNGAVEPSPDEAFEAVDYSDAILSLDDTRIEPAISAEAELATDTQAIPSSSDRIFR